MFQTVRVDRSAAEAMEWMGTKRKFWFSPPDGGRWLFKAEERGTGEDWAEKIACELAERLGVPHVQYELAEEYEGGLYLQPGVVCPEFASEPQALELGNQLLWKRDSSYPKGQLQKFEKVHQHTVDAVVECIAQLDVPGTEWLANLPAGIGTALDIFTGYVLLDAVIANQDRHHGNWGAIRIPGEKTSRLAPSFDHGASLARNVTDEERADRLRSKDTRRQIPYFCQRARSSFYRSEEDTRPLSTMDAFADFARRTADAARIWLSQLSGVTRDEIRAIIEEVPSERMSPVAKEFTFQLMVVNGERLLR
jgi:hypothetical protein